jgi:hypothetical protein
MRTMAERALTDWRPNDNQTAALAFAQEHDYAHTVVDLCKAVGISREAWYLWTRQEAFRAWWDRELDHWAHLQRSRIYSAMLAAAAGGKMPGRGDRRLWLERFDPEYAPRQRTEVSGGFDLSGVGPEELERLAHAVGGEIDIEGEEAGT